MSESNNDLVFTVKDRVDDASFQATGEAVRQHMRKMEEEGGGLRAHIESLEETFGRRSTFTHLLHMGEGAGAVIGFTMAANQIKEMADKAAELHAQLAAGEVDGSSLAVKIGEMVPVMGSFVQAGQAIREAFTGEREEIEKTEGAAEALNERLQMQLQILKESRDIYRGIVDEIRRANHEAETSGAGDPLKSISDLRFAHDEFVHRQQEEQRKRHEEVEDKAREAGNAAETAGKRHHFGQELIDTMKHDAAQAIRDEFKGILKKEDDARTALISADERRTERATSEAQEHFQKSEAERNQRADDALNGLRDRVGAAAAGQRGMPLDFVQQMIQQQADRAKDKARQELADHIDELEKGGETRPDYIEDLKKQTQETIDLLQKEADLKKQTAADEDRQKGYQREAEISKVNLELLRAQADAGDRSAKLEAEKLEAAQKYRDLQRELTAIVTNPAMSADAKDQAARQLGMLPILQALGMAGMRDTRQLPPDLAGMNSITSRGAAAAAGLMGHQREDAQLAPQHDAEREVAAQLKQLIDLLTKTFGGTPITHVFDQFMSAMRIFGIGGGSDTNGNGLHDQ